MQCHAGDDERHAGQVRAGRSLRQHDEPDDGRGRREDAEQQRERGPAHERHRELVEHIRDDRRAHPDADPGFLVLLNQLRQTDPDLAEAVINAYTGTCERLPSEAEAAAERQRQRMRQHFFKRFFRPDGLRTGRMRLNIRKIFNWIGATVALFIIVWSLIPKSSPVNSPASRVAQATSQAASQPRPPSTLSTIKSSSAPSTALSPEPPPIPLTRRPSPRLLTAAPPPGFPPPARRDSIGPVATPFSGPGGVLTPITRVIVFEANQPQPASFSPVVYQREASQATAQQPGLETGFA